MCGHCGCHEVEAITELRDEHVALTRAGDRVRRAMKDADRPAALGQLTTLVSWLTRHVEREERGIFTVSVVTLGATGWATVGHAHAAHPSFLPEWNAA